MTETDIVERESWMALRNAIIVQASNDFKDAFSDPEGHIDGLKSNRALRDECKKFFRSKWCQILLNGDESNINGKELLKKIQEQTLAELKDGMEESQMQVTLIQATPNPIDLICQIASICYDSKIVKKKQFVEKLYKSGHHSVFEHIYFTFKIEGISRACSHQLVRHRMAAITQRSQRYCEENGFEVVIPPDIRFEEELDKVYGKEIQKINDLYCELIHLHDVKKEDARYLLPNACTTAMYFSCNLRELIHIANERLCTRAQWEIRQLVTLMIREVDEELRWMLVPKCNSGFSICYTPCERNRDGYKLLKDGKKQEKAEETPEEKEEVKVE